MSKWHGGKGDKSRVSDYNAYVSNFDKIFNKDKTMREVLQWDVYGDDYECPEAVDLLEADVIQWREVDDDVEITILQECFAVGEASARGGSVFTVPKRKFDIEYKPAFKPFWND